VDAAHGLRDGPALVGEVVRRANQRVLAAAAREPKLQGMGTTLAMALLSDRGITIGHVGDSRVYRMRDGALAQLTQDHSVVNDLVANGHLAPADAGRSKQKGVLTRALGMPGAFKVDVCEHAVASDDLYLVCSDGLTAMVPDEDIANLLRDAGCDLRDTVQAAVDLANRHGGRDNVSVVVMRTA
jgi:protein phosphatase